MKVFTQFRAKCHSFIVLLLLILRPTGGENHRKYYLYSTEKSDSKMPVGCLGGGNSTNMNGAPEMDIIVTSSVLNTADQFAFMQQTLLMQIFRTTTAGHQGSSSASSSSSSSGSSSSSSMITCPTCIAFSDQCCQQESGMVLFHEFIEANLHCCVWDQKLSDALANLRYIL